ncbi:MAG: hypothetical protein R6V75_07825 [Bacteroidales bacterium]
MNVNKNPIIIGLLLLPAVLGAQNQQPVGIRFSGFVRTDIIMDSRQSSPANGIREGHFYLLPDPVSYDADSIDVNATPSFHMLNIQSRLRGDITGPDAFGAKTSGALEAEFFGTSEADLNGFRLRHAFVRLDWTRSTLMIGQNWHPMFPAEGFPGTVSFNTGAPFTPFSRNPQVNFAIRTGPVTTSFVAYAQRDFTSTGPEGPGNRYLRNSGMPGLNAQMKLAFGSGSLLRLGGDYKRIRPELRTPSNYLNPNELGSLAAFVNLHVKTAPLTLSLMGTLAQNATDLTMIGGYGVAQVLDAVTGVRTFANLNTASGWVDLTTNGKQFQAGLFAGFSKNLGSTSEFSGPLYGRGTNIDYLARVSPRIQVIREKLTFAAEVETTVANYGLTGTYGKVNNAAPVTNVRLLVAVVYRF